MEKIHRELEVIERAIDRMKLIEFPLSQVKQLQDVDLYAQIILDNVETIRNEIKAWRQNIIYYYAFYLFQFLFHCLFYQWV